MITKEEIKAYLLDVSAKGDNKIGIEIENFCVENATMHLIPLDSDIKVNITDIFEDLVKNKGFIELDKSKTIGLRGNGYSITIEPGCQIEYSSAEFTDLKKLLNQFLSYIELIDYIENKFDVRFISVSYFPVGSPDDLELIPKERYKIMDNHFKKTDKLGRHMMRFTTSLQISIDYTSASDLEIKGNKALLVMPIMLFLSANSRFKQGKDTNLRSFRTHVWDHTDKSRTRFPGKDDMWNKDRWNLDDYLEKVLDASVIFDLNSSSYKKGDGKSFKEGMNHYDIESFILHNSSIFTDIRVKKYLEIRYMDNCGLKLIPSFSILFYFLMYDDEIWENFIKKLPYSFKDIPEIMKSMNEVGESSKRIWNDSIISVIRELIEEIDIKIDRDLKIYLEPLKEKIENPFELDSLPVEGNAILLHYINKFSSDLNWYKSINKDERN